MRGSSSCSRCKKPINDMLGASLVGDVCRCPPACSTCDRELETRYQAAIYDEASETVTIHVPLCEACYERISSGECCTTSNHFLCSGCGAFVCETCKRRHVYGPTTYQLDRTCEHCRRRGALTA